MVHISGALRHYTHEFYWHFVHLLADNKYPVKHSVHVVTDVHVIQLSVHLLQMELAR